MADVRCFFCLPLPWELAAKIGAWTDSCRGSRALGGARWCSRANLHITLKFCGEIPPETVKTVSAAAKNALAGKFPSPIGLEIGGQGTFGRPPRVLFAKTEGDTGKVSALNSTIEGICREAGRPPERRRFSPHLTLARLNGAFPFDALPKWELSGEKWLADRVIFMQSRLTPQGARYSPIDVIGLVKTEV